jgi:hypothetical protein
MRAVAIPGRWIWRLSGLTTTAALVVAGSHLITSAGQAEHAQPQATVIRTVTVPEPVISLTVQSYGAPVQVTGAPVRHVQITETLMYDSLAGNLSAVPQPASAVPQPASAVPQPASGVPKPASAVPQPASGVPKPASAVPQPASAGPLSASPSAPAVPGGPLSGAPAVVQSVSGGRLSVGDPACANSDCSVSFAVTVPSDVTATVSTEGGSVSVSGIAGANLDSGGGPVSAGRIGGPLTVVTGGGSLQLGGLAGPLSADTGGGPLTAQGVTSATATVTTDGGNASLAFAAAPDTVTVSTDGGDVQLAVPGGPYALIADSDEGPQPSVGIATDAQAHRSITVSSGGGALLITPAV